MEIFYIPTKFSSDEVEKNYITEILQDVATLMIFTDGSAQGNPGPTGSDVVIKNPGHHSCGKVKHELRVTSSNPHVTSSNPRVTSSDTQVTSSNPRVTSSNPRVRTLKARVARLKARVRRLKTRVAAIKPRVR